MIGKQTHLSAQWVNTYIIKNNMKLNGVWNRVYSTNKCKTCPVKNQCHSGRVREIFEPVDDVKMDNESRLSI